jgi:hypothetical protein
VGKLIPVLDAETAGRIVASVALRPRREVVRPFLLTLFVWAHWLAPRVVEWFVHSTGARRR